MRKLLALILVLFFIGVITTTEASQEDRRNPCARRCREAYEQARERCRPLPPAAQRECLRRAREHFEACLRSCR